MSGAVGGDPIELVNGVVLAMRASVEHGEPGPANTILLVLSDGPLPSVMCESAKDRTPSSCPPGSRGLVLQLDSMPRGPGPLAVKGKPRLVRLDARCEESAGTGVEADRATVIVTSVGGDDLRGELELGFGPGALRGKFKAPICPALL